MQAKLDQLEDSLLTLPNGSANVTVTGVQSAIDKVNELDRAIEGLQDRTIRVTTNNVTTTTGGMTGAMITSPRTMPVGERGYAEALVPLQLPLNRIDPSVRHLAELIRGGGATTVAPGGGKTVNNFMTIQPVSADPSAVATQIVNRAASMANR